MGNPAGQQARERGNNPDLEAQSLQIPPNVSPSSRTLVGSLEEGWGCYWGTAHLAWVGEVMKHEFQKNKIFNDVVHLRSVICFTY